MCSSNRCLYLFPPNRLYGTMILSWYEAQYRSTCWSLIDHRSDTSWDWRIWRSIAIAGVEYIISLSLCTYVCFVTAALQNELSLPSTEIDWYYTALTSIYYHSSVHDQSALKIGFNCISLRRTQQSTILKNYSFKLQHSQYRLPSPIVTMQNTRRVGDL